MSRKQGPREAGKPVSRVRIAWRGGTLYAALEDTPTARALLAVLPVTSTANTWGEEVYFTLPFNARLEPDARQTVDPGTVCFWTQGSALALPYGRTPISEDDRPKLADRCNLLGKIEGDPRALASVRDGEAITVTRE